MVNWYGMQSDQKPAGSNYIRFGMKLLVSQIWNIPWLDSVSAWIKKPGSGKRSVLHLLWLSDRSTSEFSCSVQSRTFDEESFLDQMSLHQLTE